jgi:muramoyltetrapeptide carboxypeptidase
MKRKEFLSGAFLLAGSAIPPLAKAASSGRKPESHPRIPPSLREGDTVAVTSPAGYIRLEEVTSAVKTVESWGFRVRLGSTIGRRDCSFGGTDAERAMDLQILMDDPSVKAILCARGGYGVTRILDRIDYSRLREHPKWIIGFSDITALHLHLHRNFSIASIHSKMCNSFPDEWDKADELVKGTILSIRDALTGKKSEYGSPAHPANRVGAGQGPLVGGNLSVIQTCMGTRSEIDTKGCILFLEEVGEYLYSLDRMLTNLERAGKFRDLKGLVVGGFNRIKADDPGEEFGRTLEDMVLEKTAGLGFPVCFQFPVGHQRNNYALRCGVVHRLTVDASGARLAEV